MENFVGKTWVFPIDSYSFPLPKGDHPGAFGTKRRFDVHTGVDLYCEEGTLVKAVESGKVIFVENFTGPNAGSPWWEDTKAVWVEGDSGIVVYGEIDPFVEVGFEIQAGSTIGSVKRVLKNDKGKPMSMLHLELYDKKMKETAWWKHGENKPEYLLDPTDKLIKSLGDSDV